MTPDKIVGGLRQLAKTTPGPVTNGLVQAADLIEKQQVELVARLDRGNTWKAERARTERVRALTEREVEPVHYHDPMEGDDECPACWIGDLLRAIDGEDTDLEH